MHERHKKLAKHTVHDKNKQVMEKNAKKAIYTVQHFYFLKVKLIGTFYKSQLNTRLDVLKRIIIIIIKKVATVLQQNF